MLVDRRCVVGDQIDSRNLLEHLVDVSENNAVEVSFWAHGEEIGPSVCFHFQDSVLNFEELGLNNAVLNGEVFESRNDGQSFVFITLENKPLLLFY